MKKKERRVQLAPVSIEEAHQGGSAHRDLKRVLARLPLRSRPVLLLRNSAYPRLRQERPPFLLQTGLPPSDVQRRQRPYPRTSDSPMMSRRTETCWAPRTCERGRNDGGRQRTHPHRVSPNAHHDVARGRRTESTRQPGTRRRYAPYMRVQYSVSERIHVVCARS